MATTTALPRSKSDKKPKSKERVAFAKKGAKARRSKPRQPKPVKIAMRLPLPTLAIIDQFVKQGILGESREEVILHIMRHYMFTYALETQVRNSERAV